MCNIPDYLNASNSKYIPRKSKKHPSNSDISFTNLEFSGYFDICEKIRYNAHCHYNVAVFQASTWAFYTRVSNIWKPILAAHAPPIDIISVSDEQPDSSADDNIIDPDYWEEAYF